MSNLFFIFQDQIIFFLNVYDESSERKQSINTDITRIIFNNIERAKNIEVNAVLPKTKNFIPSPPLY